MKADAGNIGVYLNLHYSHTSAAEGTTTTEPVEGFQVSEGHRCLTVKDQARFPEEPEGHKYYFERITPIHNKKDAASAFRHSNLHSLVDSCIEGSNAGLFTMGVGRQFATDRTSVLVNAFEYLAEKIGKNDDYLMYYSYLGVTDTRCVNFVQDKAVDVASLHNGITSLLEPLTSMSDLENTLRQGSSMPFIVAIKIEKQPPQPTVGYLYLVDLGTPKWSDVPKSAGLHKSMGSLYEIATLLSMNHSGTIPYEKSLLTTLVSDLIGGNARTNFMLHLDLSSPSATTPTQRLDLLESLELGSKLRKVRWHSTPNYMDPRLERLDNKYYTLKSSYAELQTVAEQLKSTVLQRDTEVKEFVEAIEELENTVVGKDRAIKQLKKEHDALVKKSEVTEKELGQMIKELEMKLASERGKVSELNASKTQLLKSLESRDGDVSKTSQEITRVMNDKKELQTQLESMNTKLKDFESRYEELEIKNKSTETKFKELRGENDSLAQDYYKLQQERNKLLRQLTDAESNKELVEADLGRAQKDLSKLLGEVKSKEKLLGTEREEWEQTSKEIQDVAKEWDRKVKALEVKVRRLEAELVEAENTILELRTQVRDAKRVNANANANASAVIIPVVESVATVTKQSSQPRAKKQAKAVKEAVVEEPVSEAEPEPIVMEEPVAEEEEEEEVVPVRVAPVAAPAPKEKTKATKQPKSKPAPVIAEPVVAEEEPKETNKRNRKRKLTTDDDEQESPEKPTKPTKPVTKTNKKQKEKQPEPIITAASMDINIDLEPVIAPATEPDNISRTSSSASSNLGKKKRKLGGGARLDTSVSGIEKSANDAANDNAGKVQPRNAVNPVALSNIFANFTIPNPK